MKIFCMKLNVWIIKSIPWNNGSEINPFPSILIAKTAILILAADGQRDAEVLNKWAHIPSVHDEAGMIAKPQILPEVESE